MKIKTSIRKTAEIARDPRRKNRRHKLGLAALVNLAKEIRTPLDTLQAANRHLLETDPNPEQRELIDRSRISADTLLTLVNDLLDYSRIEAGKLSLARINFDLRTTVEDTVQLLTGRAGAKRLRMGCLIHHQVPSLLFGDPGRLRQILIHLNQLAFRYTDRGEILTQVTLEKEDKARAFLHFAVMQEGKGIPPSHRARLFRYPASPVVSGSKMGEGSDIGLALSRRLVETMGGRIGVESRRGKGATFWFTALFRKQKVNGAVPGFSPRVLQGKRVLVVDEKTGSRRSLKEQIRSWGCLADNAGGGREAMVRLCQAVEDGTPYDLAVLSKEMEEMDGIQLAREIKSSPVLRDILVVLLASQGDRGEGRLMQEIGVSGYLTQPFKGSQLRDCLGLALSRKAYPGQAPAVPLITRHSLAEEKKRRVRILLASHDMQDRSVALRTLQNMGYSADAATRGSEARTALAGNPYDLVLIDADLPGMEPAEAVEALRGRERETGRRVAIVGMTAAKSHPGGEKSRKEGMDDFLSKPVRPVDLAEVMERLLAEEG